MELLALHFRTSAVSSLANMISLLYESPYLNLDLYIFRQSDPKETGGLTAEEILLMDDRLLRSVCFRTRKQTCVFDDILRRSVDARKEKDIFDHDELSTMQ